MSGAGTLVAADFSSVDVRGRIERALSTHSTVSLSGSYQNQNDLEYPGRLLNAEFFETGMAQVKYEFLRDDGWLRELTVRASAQQTLHEMTNRGKPTFEAGATRPPLRIGVRSELQNLSGRMAADLSTGIWDLTAGGDVLYTYRDAVRPLEAVMPDGSRVVPPFY